MSNQVTLQVSATEEKIAGRINAGVMNTLAVSDSAGGLSFANVDQVMEVAKLMAISQVAVPKHLRGNPGACIAVCIQAIEWRMSPFAVANKSYSVNDRMAYEAQLIQAVILQRAPIKGRIKVEYTGDGEKRQCRVWAVLREDEEIVEYISPEFGKIQPKNSPLWKSDPDQQQFYSSVRALCRRHFPDVLLGVYAKDEIEDGRGFDNARDVSPRPPLAQRLRHSESTTAQGFSTEHVDAETGEITDEPAQSEMERRVDETIDETLRDQSDADAAQDVEETLLDRARTVALSGSKALMLWHGKLNQAEADDLQGQYASLKRAAQAADREKAGAQ